MDIRISRQRFSDLARQLNEERRLKEAEELAREPITSKSFSKSSPKLKSNSNNTDCVICLQEIRPNSKNIFTCTAKYKIKDKSKDKSKDNGKAKDKDEDNGKECGAKIHKKCLKEYCVSSVKTYKRKQYINCPICKWSYYCKDNFEKTSDEINKAIKNK